MIARTSTCSGTRRRGSDAKSMPPSLRRISIVGAISLLGLVVVDRHLLNTVVQRGSNNRTIHLQWDDRGITTPKAEQPQGEQIDACNPWAPWSLQSQSASWRPLRCLNAYDAVTSHNGRRRAWNAFAILGPMLSRAGYRGNCFSRVGSHTRHSLVLSEVQALQNTVQGCILPFSDVIFTPNFWAPAAPDWRQWRLMPCQRINRCGTCVPRSDFHLVLLSMRRSMRHETSMACSEAFLALSKLYTNTRP